MNYLAHLHLAENTAASRVGNMLGDFVTGRPESLRGRFPPAVLHGIVRHRAIDRFADDHPSARALRGRIAPARRRFAGVIVDILHDHFLTRHWSEFCEQPLAGFIGHCNAALRAHRAILPAELGDTLEHRIADNWLGRYGSEDGLEEVFHLVAARRPAFAPIREAMEDLRLHRGDFEQGFRQLFPDLRTWVRQQGPEADILI